MTCPTCGRSDSSKSKIALWICGGIAATFFAFCALIIICLTAVSAIGEESSEAYERVRRDLQTTEFNLQVEAGEGREPGA